MTTHVGVRHWNNPADHPPPPTAPQSFYTQDSSRIVLKFEFILPGHIEIYFKGIV